MAKGIPMPGRWRAVLSGSVGERASGGHPLLGPGTDQESVREKKNTGTSIQSTIVVFVVARARIATVGSTGAVGRFAEFEIHIVLTVCQRV